MTTICANLEGMAADTLVSYASSFEGKPKIWHARHSLWGAAGGARYCAEFRLWTLGKGRRPEIPTGEDADEDAVLEVLQLHQKDGLFLWTNNALPERIAESFFAIGSGGAHALGAMAMGATPAQAIAVAAKYDSCTREPINVLPISEIKGTRKPRK